MRPKRSRQRKRKSLLPKKRKCRKKNPARIVQQSLLTGLRGIAPSWSAIRNRMRRMRKNAKKILKTTKEKCRRRKKGSVKLQQKKPRKNVSAWKRQGLPRSLKQFFELLNGRLPRRFAAFSPVSACFRGQEISAYQFQLSANRILNIRCAVRPSAAMRSYTSDSPPHFFHLIVLAFLGMRRQLNDCQRTVVGIRALSAFARLSDQHFGGAARRIHRNGCAKLGFRKIMPKAIGAQ